MRVALRRYARPAALTALAAIAHELVAAEAASGDPFAALIAGRPGLALLALALLALRLALVVVAPAFWLRALALEAWRAYGARGRG
ncbi:MAG TPA: hypothetical protein VFS43_12530 [Polyangiaceae bacterium]|nr:hypothetical protein [Polyangiaceae bacterium]